MKNTMLFYRILKIIIYPIYRLLWHPHVIGKDNIPENGGVIFCGNHTKWLDTLLLITTTKRKIHFFAKVELFDTKLKNWFFTKVGCIPVNRKEKNKDALIAGYNYLNEGEVVGIFPEGTINRTNAIIMPFKYGAVKMALETKKKILPFAIVGKYKIFGKGNTIVYGEPYYLKTDDLEKENDLLMEKVIKLIKENTR